MCRAAAILSMLVHLFCCVKVLTRRFRPNKIWTDGHSRQRDRSPGRTCLSLPNYGRISAAISYALGDLLLPAYSRYGLCRKIRWDSSRPCWYISHRHTHSTYTNDYFYHNKKDRWNSGKTRPPTNSLLWHPEVVILLLENISIPYRSPATQNVSAHDFDLSRSLKVKFYSAIWLKIYRFLLMFNGNIGPKLLYEILV